MSTIVACISKWVRMRAKFSCIACINCRFARNFFGTTTKSGPGLWWLPCTIVVHDPPSQTQRNSEVNTTGIFWNFGMNRLFQKLLAPTDLADFEPENYHNYQTYFAIANFLPERNVIRFSASMLQPPFFHKAFPKAMNYGAIGSTIGHEFTHGFDDEGSERDDQGYYKVWWTQETQANFLKQKQCIIDQYSAFRVPEMNMNVNGSHTAAENLADNGGLKEAYMAYHTYLKKLGHEEERLRGYENYSNDQLFFIGFGARQCVKMTKKVLSWHLVGDPHALGRFRVNGVVSNSPEFAAAFKCPTGSPMNPVKKCRVW